MTKTAIPSLLTEQRLKNINSSLFVTFINNFFHDKCVFCVRINVFVYFRTVSTACSVST